MTPVYILVSWRRRPSPGSTRMSVWRGWFWIWAGSTTATAPRQNTTESVCKNKNTSASHWNILQAQKDQRLHFQVKATCVESETSLIGASEGCTAHRRLQFHQFWFIFLPTKSYTFRIILKVLYLRTLKQFIHINHILLPMSNVTYEGCNVT